MTTPLLDAAPGFDRPIAVLKHCHDRIRKQLATLEKLLAHLPGAGADAQAQQAAAAVIKYFDQGAPLHHADEEENLIPMLRAVAQGDDAATLQALAPVILEQHQQMDATWLQLREHLNAIAAGTDASLSVSVTQQFIEAYTAHMLREESTLAPMAMRLFSPAQMQQLGEAMHMLTASRSILYLFQLENIIGVANDIDWNPTPDERLWMFAAKPKK